MENQLIQYLADPNGRRASQIFEILWSSSVFSESGGFGAFGDQAFDAKRVAKAVLWSR